MKFENHQARYAQMKKQYNLYDDFLIHPETSLTKTQRKKLIYEMGRMLFLMKNYEYAELSKSKRTISNFNKIKIKNE